MKSAVFTAVAALAASVSGTPFRMKREVGGVLTCTGANATGECAYNVYELSTCHQLEPPFYENIKTFAPDGEAFQCFPRLVDCGGICTSPTGCTFGAVDFAYENKYDLSAIGWDKLFTSFDCVRKQ